MSQIILKKQGKAKVADTPPPSTLSCQQLQELWTTGRQNEVRKYVKTHYLNSQAQLWLMQTKNISLIKAYLQKHPETGLFEDAEEMLIALKDKTACLAYINNRPLRHRSILTLFAEKETEILQAHLAKYPDDSFSRLAIILMFELGNKKLIQQYLQLHPSMSNNANYREKLKKIGLLH